MATQKRARRTIWPTNGNNRNFMTQYVRKHIIPPMKKLALQILKLIGIAMFVWIMSRIETAQLIEHIQKINIYYFLLLTLLVLCIYAIKTMRWRILVKKAGLDITYRESWKIYNIGVFLAILTPAKLGEIGRAAYLKKAGMQNLKAIGVVLADKIADIAVMAVIALIGIGILFSIKWMFIGLLIMCCGLAAGIFAIKKMMKTFSNMKLKTALLVIGLTTLSWGVYFLWAVLLAKGVGIQVPVHILIATFTLVGIVALLPIAPSGLGTRDAALLTLLTPYGVAPEQSIALSFLMFLTIIISSSIGLLHWWKGMYPTKIS